MHLLFVCTGNTCRSPMAEAICRRLAAGHTAGSAGLFAGDAVSPHAAAAMAEWGENISGRAAVQLTEGMCGDADLIAVMSEGHAAILREQYHVPEEKIRILGIPDPFGGDMETYRTARNSLIIAIQKLLSDIQLQSD